MKKIKITIEGMHCTSCANNIERALKKVKGVKEVSVSVMTKKAILQIEDNVSDSSLMDAVKDVGFKITNIEK